MIQNYGSVAWFGVTGSLYVRVRNESSLSFVILIEWHVLSPILVVMLDQLAGTHKELTCQELVPSPLQACKYI